MSRGSVFGPRPRNEGQRAKTVAAGAAFVARALRRQRPIFLTIMAASLVAGVLYLVMAVPIYVADASILVDVTVGRPSLSANRSGEGYDDAVTVETEREVIKSRKVSRAVIDQLHLSENAGFDGEGRGIVAAVWNLRGLLGVGPAATQADRDRAVLEAFETHRDATRVGRSRVIEISAWSADPAEAARIADAIAQAYIEGEVEARFEAMRRTTTALQEHLDELRAKSAARHLAAQTFREKNKIDDAGGRLASEQISQLGNQLIQAQALTAEAKVRYDRVRDIVIQDVPDASIADVFKNDIIVRLRARYLDLAARESLWSQKYGPSHSSVVSLRSQLQEILRSIKDEMRKIEEAYKSDYEIARAREQTVGESLREAMGRAQAESSAQVELDSLESGAQATKTLQDRLLERYLESVEQQSFPVSEARLISPAEAPRSPVFPRGPIVLALALTGGLVVSFAVATLLDFRDRTFRSTDDVTSALGTRCLAVLPRIEASPATKGPMASAVGGSGPSKPGFLAPLPPGSLLDYVVREPFSHFSESLRSVKLCCDAATSGRPGRVIGITSALPDEGKSTIAANLAELVASGGTSAVLVDADLRHPALSDEWTGSKPGLAELLAGAASLEDMLYHDPRTGLALLTAGSRRLGPNTSEWLGGEPMGRLIAALRERFAYVFFDLPPLVPVVDARATARFIDRYVFVVEWGGTRIEAGKAALANAPEIAERLLGVVLNKVDMASLARYERDFARFDHAGYHARYSETAEPPRGRRQKA